MKLISVRVYIVIAIILPLLAMILIALISLRGLYKSSQSYQTLANTDVPLILAAEDLRASGAKTIQIGNELALLTSLNVQGEELENELQQLEDTISEFVAHRTTLDDLLQEGTFLDTQGIDIATNNLIEQTLTFVEGFTESTTAETLETLKEDYEDVEISFYDALDTLIAYEEIALDQAQTQAQDQFTKVQRQILLMTIMTFVITNVIGKYIADNTISFPILKIAQTTRNIASGKLQERIHIINRSEIGDLAKSINTMADNLEARIEDAEEARAEAERSNQVKSAFLASMSHELRTPLNSVINFTKFVARGVMGPVNERQAETLEKVISSGQHLLQLINDVLDMSKIEAGSMTLFIEENLNINEIIQNALLPAETALIDKDVKLDVQITPDLPTMTGDRKRLTQIFMNVIANACKFTDEGHIKVNVSMPNGSLCVSVEDTGPGIAEEDYINVFSPFIQTEIGKLQGEGTGLGMPISKSLTEAHGGKLWFESQVGKGTTFYITLPIEQGEA